MAEKIVAQVALNRSRVELIEAVELGGVTDCSVGVERFKELGDADVHSVAVALPVRERLEVKKKVNSQDERALGLQRVLRGLGERIELVGLLEPSPAQDADKRCRGRGVPHAADTVICPGSMELRFGVGRQLGGIEIAHRPRTVVRLV